MSPSGLARKVYALVRRVPRGRVATYGQIAYLAGYPGAARAVGSALRRLPPKLEGIVPWHRIVTSQGVSQRRSAHDKWRQRDLLRDEGVEVGAGGAIDLQRYGWEELERRTTGRTPRSLDDVVRSISIKAPVRPAAESRVAPTRRRPRK